MASETKTDQSITLGITGMTCAACSNRIEKSLSKMEGINKVNINLATEKAAISFNPAQTSIDKIIDKVQRTGYGVSEERSTLQIKDMTCVFVSTE